MILHCLELWVFYLIARWGVVDGGVHKVGLGGQQPAYADGTQEGAELGRVLHEGLHDGEAEDFQMVVEIFAELVHQVHGLVFVLVAKAGEEVFDEPFVVFHHLVAVVLLLA